ncbi:glycosyltransferase family 61 protein [Vibrio metschnikovii]|uniref:glycosyltransferase family 61 protein n=1 Tax=Vibrio metschnikovii TaxID=28172 RepID=UPI001C306375|nr:glycosyltransferase 61 family protein [Vibrio metschnikovii]
MKLWQWIGRKNRLTYKIHHLIKCIALQRHGSDFRFYGGLYDENDQYLLDGGLVTNKQQIILPLEKNQLPDFNNSQHLSGLSLYAGVLHNHYGHFLTESLARLWPIKQIEQIDHIVYLSTTEHVPDFVYQFFELIGLKDKLHIIDSESLIVEKLIVAKPTLEYPNQFQSDYLALREELLSHNDFPSNTDTRPLFVSRTNLCAGYERMIIGERQIEQRLSASGAVVIYPETLSLEEQIRYFNAHQTIIGYAGSAMHNLLYTRGNKQILMYTGRKVPIIYKKIDKALNNRATYANINHIPPTSALQIKTGFKPEILNPSKLEKYLRKLPLSVSQSNPTNQNQACLITQYNTAVLLRHVVELFSAKQPNVKATYDYWAQEYPLDSDMINDAIQKSPLLNAFFTDQ